MTKTIPLLFFSILSLSLFSQELKISNGQKQKILKPSSILIVNIADVNTSFSDENCCNNYSELEGSIKAIDSDSILFQVNKLQNFRTIENAIISDHYYSPKTTSTANVKVAISNITSIRKYNSLKARKRSSTLQVFGGILAISGLVTTLNTLLVKSKNNKRDFLILGLGQLGLGITLGLSGTPKRYNFRSHENPWVIQQ